MLSRTIFVIFALMFISMNNYGQISNGPQNSQAMLNTDVFIVNLMLDSVFSEKPIKINFGNGNKYFIIHNVTIENIFYIADSSYLSRKDLIGSKYVLVPCEVLVQKGEQLFASIYATTTDGVFILSRLLSKKDININKIWYSTVVKNVDLNSKRLEKCFAKGKQENY